MSRELREESSALHALGLLAGDELARFRQECQADPTLSEMSRVLREVTSQLVHWAPPYSAPEALRERVLHGLDSRRGPTGGPQPDRADHRPAG
jgi:hypothetical protein